MTGVVVVLLEVAMMRRSAVRFCAVAEAINTGTVESNVSRDADGFEVVSVFFMRVVASTCILVLAFSVPELVPAPCSGLAPVPPLCGCTQARVMAPASVVQGLVVGAEVVLERCRSCYSFSMKKDARQRRPSVVGAYLDLQKYPKLWPNIPKW